MDEQKLKKFATLLAQSTLEPEIKESIMSNLESMSVQEFDALYLALENEEKVLRKISREIDEASDKQEGAWEDLTLQQRELAENIIEQSAKQLGEEAAASSIRKSLE